MARPFPPSAGGGSVTGGRGGHASRLMARPVGSTAIPIWLVAGAIVAVILALVLLFILRGGPPPEEAVLGERATGEIGEPLPIRFGREVDPITGAVTSETTRFRAGQPFAYSFELPSRIGVRTVMVGLYRLEPDGEETTVQDPARAAQPVDPGQTTVSYQVEADALLATFGPGEYVMRIYRGEELLAEGRFRLSD
jgi:hypothetical protein